MKNGNRTKKVTIFNIHSKKNRGEPITMITAYNYLSALMVDRIEAMRAIISAGITPQGHIGLTHQSMSKLGSFKVQGKHMMSAKNLLDDALALEAPDYFSIMLEAVPHRVAEIVTKRLKIPTIGIGAGPKCGG